MKTILKLILKNKLPVLIGVLALIIIVLFSMLRASNQEKKRYQANQHSLLENVTFYRTKDSLSAASVEKLTLTTKEFKKHEIELLETIDDLNLKVKRLQSVSETGTETKYEVKTIIKDSLVYIEGKPVKLPCVNFSNKWLTVDGCVVDNQFSGWIESRDTLIQVVHRVPRKFLFFRYGTKAIQQEVISKNPYTTLTYAKYIEFKK